MKIILAKDAGYCFGVRDAVNMAYDSAEKNGDVYMLGDIVHNENVVNDLEKVGVKVVKDLKDVPKEKPILFRAHGTKTDLWKEAESENMKVIPINSGSKVMIEHIKDGYFLGLISDQNAGAKGTEALFFNHTVSVPKGAAAFHLKTNSPILLGFCILCKDLHYKLSFSEMDLQGLPQNSNDAIVEINKRFTKVLEEKVREYPEQYFWFHRKWPRQIYRGTSH